MRYGFFDDARREYVITRPDTPLPWINYLGSQDYFGLISNTAGGYSFYRDARLRRLTRYRYNNVPNDSGGRYLYLRDEASGAFWSPTWQPTRTTLDEYSCRHGLGYTVIASTCHGIAAETTYFVPRDHNLEVWRLTVTNRRPEPAELSVFSAIEFCLWDAWDDATNFQRNFSTGEVEVEEGVIYHKTEYRERRDHFAYFACSDPVSGTDTQRESFLGPYSGWDAPAVVVRGESANSHAHGWSPIGSHHLRLSLAPGASHTMVFVLGYAENPAEAKFDPPGSQRVAKQAVLAELREFLDPARVESALTELAKYWDGLLGVFTVQTPDLHANRMAGIWNAYQCMITSCLSRSASYFESGIGRGMGFRDSNQDILGFVHMAPSRARERILDLAATQLPSGGAYHQYQPLTKRGNDLIGGGFNDDPLWLILAAAAYLKETGDLAILATNVPYDNQAGSEMPLYEHLRRSLGYTLDRLGPHGLPLIGRADWNDCLNLNCFSETPGESFQTTGNDAGETAESVFIAALFVVAAGELASVAELVGKLGDAADFRADARRVAAAVDVSGWDGAWFRRAYDAFGQPVGAQACQEGQIFIEPQGVCIMAGIGLHDGRAALALNSVSDRLATSHGIILQQPAYSQYHPHLGEISSYPPGYKENAGIFCHANPWIMIAETMIGRGDRAHDYYLRINPSYREDFSEVHRCEPYVYAQMIAGRDAPSFGEAKNSWLTGAAAWNYVALTQWILGIRPDHHGLRVAPVIPANWPGFTATRAYRGVMYRIAVSRRGPGNGVSLTVDGQPAAGDLVPFPPPGQAEVNVEAYLA